MVTTWRGAPAADGYRMPGEFEKHAGTWMLWPTRTDTWRLGAKPAQEAYRRVALAIASFEPVTIGVNGIGYEHVRRVMPGAVRVVELSSNDAWMRDIGPTFVKNDATGEVRGIDWGFNAWGGLNGGLYFPWDLDRLAKQKVLEIEGKDRYDVRDFIMEGGAIAADGEGTLIATEQCLLHPNRNPRLSRTEIESRLGRCLGVRRIVWLKRGLADDETDGHVDELAAFAAPGVVLLAWTDDPAHPQYEIVREAEAALDAQPDAHGRRLRIERIPLPDPIELTATDSRTIDRAEQSFGRTPGTRLAASYVNFYFCNGALILPSFGDRRDREAHARFAALFPDRKVVQVYTREIALGGGNVHCITQQVPAGSRE